MSPREISSESEKISVDLQGMRDSVVLRAKSDGISISEMTRIALERYLESGQGRENV